MKRYGDRIRSGLRAVAAAARNPSRNLFLSKVPPEFSSVANAATFRELAVLAININHERHNASEGGKPKWLRAISKEMEKRKMGGEKARMLAQPAYLLFGRAELNAKRLFNERLRDLVERLNRYSSSGMSAICNW